MSQHRDKTAADHLGLNYVTERILASVLPIRCQQLQQKHQRDNEFNNDGPQAADAALDESPQDIYEQELISMLEQKHGKVNKNMFFVQTINQSMEHIFKQKTRPNRRWFCSFVCKMMRVFLSDFNHVSFNRITNYSIWNHAFRR